MVLEKVLVHRLAYVGNILYLFLNCYYISCHVVAHQLDVNNLISISDYEKTLHTYCCNITYWTAFENDLGCKVLK